MPEDDTAFALRLARYCARNPVALERLEYDAKRGRVKYRSDKIEGPTAGSETVDPLEFLAQLATHIPDKHQVMTRYYGWYSNRRPRARGISCAGALERWAGPARRLQVACATSRRTELSTRWIPRRLVVAPTEFYRWTERYGAVDQHNGKIPRDHCLRPEERKAILDFHAARAISSRPPVATCRSCSARSAAPAR